MANYHVLLLLLVNIERSIEFALKINDGTTTKKNHSVRQPEERIKIVDKK
jgi:hypothetical protein